MEEGGFSDRAELVFFFLAPVREQKPVPISHGFGWQWRAARAVVSAQRWEEHNCRHA